MTNGKSKLDSFQNNYLRLDEYGGKEWSGSGYRKKLCGFANGSYIDVDGTVVAVNQNSDESTPAENRLCRLHDAEKYTHGGKTMIADILEKGLIEEFNKSYKNAETLPSSGDSFENAQNDFNSMLNALLKMENNPGKDYYDVSNKKPEFVKKRSSGKKKSMENRSEVDTYTMGAEGSKEKIDETLGNRRNQIYFGAPGTGKSYALNEEAKRQFRGNVERVTFYADYLHSQFVGSYKPVMADNDTDIRYEFQPGPFSRILVKALEHEDTPYCLIVEELNRAEAASVFGDLFQLLDRDSNGVSQYPVSVSEDFKKYLEDNLTSTGKNNLESLVKEALDSTDVPNGSCGMIVIPSNMYIWATMNSADQGVFPLDTAFKRRWNFRYFPLDDGKEKMCTENDMRWNQIREAINNKLIKLGVNEDKCMGPFFLNEEERNNDFDDAFKNKVIMYLFEDAAKYHKELFAQRNTTLSGLFTAWDNNKKSVFCESVTKEISDVFSPQQKSDGGTATDKSNEQPGGENEDAPSADSANSEPAQDGNDN